MTLEALVLSAVAAGLAITAAGFRLSPVPLPLHRQRRARSVA